MTLAKYIQSKNNFDGVAMLRLNYAGQSYDYSNWRIVSPNLFFLDDNLNLKHILWFTDTVSVIDENIVSISLENHLKTEIHLEVFYGGATL